MGELSDIHISPVYIADHGTRIANHSLIRYAGRACKCSVDVETALLMQGNIYEHLQSSLRQVLLFFKDVSIIEFEYV